METMDKENKVTLHLKTERIVRDRLLGSLRARGTTMQHFFDTLMRTLVANPAHIEKIEQWGDETPVLTRD